MHKRAPPAVSLRRPCAASLRRDAAHSCTRRTCAYRAIAWQRQRHRAATAGLNGCFQSSGSGCEALIAMSVEDFTQTGKQLPRVAKAALRARCRRPLGTTQHRALQPNIPHFSRASISDPADHAMETSRQTIWPMGAARWLRAPL
jgi:hypothetical protein